MSSLVTLFANILQNPQDTRARSDLRLMSSVVSFLTMLEHDMSDANSNIHRMLQVCSEFERIAKVVLDRAEREMRGRGKRKQAERERQRDRASGAISADIDDGKTLEQLQIETQAAYRRPVQTPSLKAASIQGSATSPASWVGSQTGTDRPVHGGNGSMTPNNGVYASLPGQGNFQQAPTNLHMGLTEPQYDHLPPGDFSQPQHSLTDGFDPATGMHPPNINNPLADLSMNNTYLSPDLNSGLTESYSGSFQQPFVPQDLWQAGLSIEWDMFEGLNFGSFTPGPGLGEHGINDERHNQHPGTNFG